MIVKGYVKQTADKFLFLMKSSVSYSQHSTLLIQATWKYITYHYKQSDHMIPMMSATSCDSSDHIVYYVLIEPDQEIHESKLLWNHCQSHMYLTKPLQIVWTTLMLTTHA